MNSLIVFYIVAALIIVSSVLAVTSRRILRAATYLLFVLIATGALYLLLNYHFLAAVQISVYAGGILILFIFAILLTRQKSEVAEPSDRRKIITGILTAVCGAVVTGMITLKQFFYFPLNSSTAGDQEISMTEIGKTLMGTGKYQYLLPFEILSVLLLVAVIGGILIARKKQ